MLQRPEPNLGTPPHESALVHPKRSGTYLNVYPGRLVLLSSHPSVTL
jgi:hypothetical protein